MNTQSEIDLMKSAWRTAVTIRTCPPKNLSQDDEEHLKGHMERCPFCAAMSYEPDESEAWEELGRAMTGLAEEPKAAFPEPGQVWSIKQDLEGWDDEYRYFNSVMVLIIELNRDLQAVKVSQLYSDLTLMGSDDVYLGQDLGFAQPWNIYTLALEDLGTFWQKTDLTAVNEVKKASQSKFQEIEPNSSLYFFRQLELEAGAFFSLQSIERLMARVDGAERPFLSALDPGLQDPDELCHLLARQIPGVDLDTGSSDPYQILALMRLPEDEVALAAASEPDLATFNLVVIEEDRIYARSKQAIISHTSVLEGQGWLTGHFVESQQIQQLVVWWRKDDQTMIKADDVKSDQKYFRALFSRVGSDFFDSGSPILLGLSYDLET